MLKIVLLAITGVLAAGLLLLAAALWQQDLPWSDPPGPWARLGVYLGRNVAATGVPGGFPELAPVYLRGADGDILDQLRRACEALGWGELRIDTGARRIDAVVTTPWLGFKDDFRVELAAAGAGRWRLDMRSSSRIGRGDLGANERHILDLLGALERAGAAARREP